MQQVSVQVMYEKVKGELALMHERALISEAICEQLEKENEDLKLKLAIADEALVQKAAMESGSPGEEVEDAFLEKLKQEVPDVKPE